MSRTARIVLPGYPHHVVHRGHNRQRVFCTAGDHEAYLTSLQQLKAEYRVQLHAYCLMPNHVHLLLAPETEDGLALLMKRVAGRHAARCNRRAGRTGAVWEGRYFSSLVARESYYLRCCRYIELNPVRAGLAYDPTEYPWSSCRYRADGTLPWFELDPLYLAMGADAAERWDTYRAFLAGGVPDDERALIRDAVYRGQLTGDEAFAKGLTERIGRLVQRRGRGRPPKQEIDPSFFSAMGEK